jgi:hypothetical protein
VAGRLGVSHFLRTSLQAILFQFDEKSQIVTLGLLRKKLAIGPSIGAPRSAAIVHQINSALSEHTNFILVCDRV